MLIMIGEHVQILTQYAPFHAACAYREDAVRGSLIQRSMVGLSLVCFGWIRIHVHPGFRCCSFFYRDRLRGCMLASASFELRLLLSRNTDFELGRVMARRTSCHVCDASSGDSSRTHMM